MNSKLNDLSSKSFSMTNIRTSLILKFPLLMKLLAISTILYLINQWTASKKQLSQDNNSYINSPQVNDLYFLNYHLLPGVKADSLRPGEKYRLAKVVDITGDIITLLYGSFFYRHQSAIEASIHYGQLRYPGYFETRRYDFQQHALKTMVTSGAIYMVKRPLLNKLFGNEISPSHPVYRNKAFIPGKKQNNTGLAFLNDRKNENHLQQAFEHFQQSANYGYAQGQINLAAMYLSGQHVTKDLTLALYWFKQAALQSHKPGILKYKIVCKQVVTCDIVDFYDQLITAGVNVKVRKLEFTLK